MKKMQGDLHSSKMSREEIETRFPGEWILLEDPETSDSLKILSGKVLSHSLNRDEVYQRALELRPRQSAILFTGKLSEDMAIVL
jgi:hypothetical protein